MQKLYVFVAVIIMGLSYPKDHDPLRDSNNKQIEYKEFNNYTNGGPGGKIIKVTNLNPSGKGSLRHAIETTGSRIVVFEVGGIIDLDMSSLTINNPNITIAGQTAPYPGITIIKGGITVLTHDVIIKHLRVRPGDASKAKRSGWEPDGISIYGEKAHHILIDHCSVTWAVDENLSVSGPRFLGSEYTAHNVTFCNNIIAEGLHDSSHSKGKHSKGSLVHDNCSNVAIIGNLYAHNADRNPYFKANTTGVIVNNLIYNPESAAIRLGYSAKEWKESGLQPSDPLVSIVGNVFYKGVDSNPHLELVKKANGIFMNDNLAYDHDGSKSKLKNEDAVLLEEKPIWMEGLKPIYSLSTVNFIVSNVGARPAERDSIDQRIVKDLLNRTGRIIDSQEQVGGYPQYKSTYRQLIIPQDKLEKWLNKMEEEVKGQSLNL